jgi:tRNA pseudouridine38-40 synthase
MVGSLVEVGAGRWSADQLQSALEAKDRRRCGQVAPAQGLYLTKVEYAPHPLPDANGEEEESG